MASRAKSVTASIGYASSGVRYFFASQRNARVQGLAGLGAVVLAALLRLSPLEWAALTLAIALVLVAEVINTALETLTDLVTLEFHPLAKQAKDLAAAAVWMAAIAALVVGALLFLPHLAFLTSWT